MRYSGHEDCDCEEGFYWQITLPDEDHRFVDRSGDCNVKNRFKNISAQTLDLTVHCPNCNKTLFLKSC